MLDYNNKQRVSSHLQRSSIINSRWCHLIELDRLLNARIIPDGFKDDSNSKRAARFTFCSWTDLNGNIFILLFRIHETNPHHQADLSNIAKQLTSVILGTCLFTLKQKKRKFYVISCLTVSSLGNIQSDLKISAFFNDKPTQIVLIRWKPHHFKNFFVN